MSRVSGSESETSKLGDSGDEDYEPEIIDRVGDSEEGEENKEKPEELTKNKNEQETEGEPVEEGKRRMEAKKPQKQKKQT